MGLIYAAMPGYGRDWFDRQVSSAVLSIRSHVDKVVLFDGSWSGEPSKELPDWWGTGDCVFVPCGKWGNEPEKRTFMTEWGGPGSWCFWLDTDEILLAGGEWIRRALQINPNAGRFKVTLIDKDGQTYFRENMFEHGSYIHGSKDIGIIPTVIRHIAGRTKSFLTEASRV